MQTIFTDSNNFAAVQSANNTDTVFDALVPTVTAPAADSTRAVIAVGPSDGKVPVPNNILLLPYGTGTDTTTFSLRVVGWKKVSTLWVPVILCEVSCAISTGAGCTGVASTAVLATEFFADTITLITGVASVDNVIVSPANDTPAHLVVDIKGFSMLEITFDRTGATACNALYAFL